MFDDGVRPLEKSPGRSLQRQLVDQVGRRIAHGIIAPGEVLSPDALGREFGVSRSIVRESLRALEALGMITARSRIGTVVCAESDWQLLDARVIEWRTDGPDARRQLRELTDLRLAIEPAAADRAAQSRSEEDLDELSGHFQRMSAALADRDPAAFALADTAFHTAIMRASRSAILYQLSGTLAAALRSRYSTGLPTFTHASDLAVRRHGALLAALRARQGAEAASIMRLLISESQAELFE